VRPTLHPRLVNGRFGDPAVYVEALHRPDAVLFDLGDLSLLSARDLLRIRYVFVSHMHMDHFIGFDRLLRVNVGRDKCILMVGPAGLAAAVAHKLQAYTWDLVDRYKADLVFDVVEVAEADARQGVRHRLKAGFAAEAITPAAHGPGPVLQCADFDLHVAVLEHHGPSLGFAIEEPLHVNVWRNRLEERGLMPGPWLQAFKRAIAAGAGDHAIILLPEGTPERLGSLRDLASVERGQKLAYVTDIADTRDNRARIAALANGADTLFIEAGFSATDVELARARAHLTTRAAGEMARAAGVRRVEPFHFSPRYEGEEERMLAEVAAAFAGTESNAGSSAGPACGST
jgi:ribonuclease Z